MKVLHLTIVFAMLLVGCEKENFSDAPTLTVEEARKTVNFHDNKIKGDGILYSSLSIYAKQITPAVASELSKYKGDSISLKTEEISSEVAKELTENFQGELEINNVRKIDVPTLKNLSKLKSISLMGAELDAENLATIVNGGSLYLSLGNKSLSDEAADVLSKSKFEILALMRLEKLSSKNVQALGNSSIRLVMFGPHVLFDEVGLEELEKLEKRKMITSNTLNSARIRLKVEENLKKKIESF